MSLLGAAGQVGYVALPIMVGLESAGLPLPGEASLIAAAVLAAQGHMDLPAVLALAALGAIVGDNLGYALGRRFGRAALLAPGLLHARRAKIVADGERFFARHGTATVFLGRFVAVGRIAVAWLAGADRMPWRRFATVNALGSVTWATMVGLAAYLLGSADARWLGLALGLIGVLALLRALRVGQWTRRHLRGRNR